MNPEIEKDDRLPDTVLAEKAADLIIEAFGILQKNEGFKAGAAKRFLKNPQGTGFNYKSGQMTFESKGQEYLVNLTRTRKNTELNMITMFTGVEEIIKINIIYDEEYQGASTLFGGIRSDSVKEARISYLKLDRRDDTNTETYVNDSKACGKVTEFLRRI
jgi:hypothetical protein